MANDNKKIAKNTLYLYLRLLVTMPLAFYTSRVLLQQLGVDDFGIYNAVSGIVVMFSSLRGAFASATQRFYNFAIGKGENKKLFSIFSTSITIHFFICIILITAIEVFGLWFIKNELVFPIERINAVYFVFQTVVISTVFIIMMIPFDAMVIAKERMSFYAHISILDVIFKLALVLSLFYIEIDKLKLYAIFMMLVSIIICSITIIYCYKNFIEIRGIIKFDKKIFKEMASFSIWNLFGNIAYSLVHEGINLILNLFGGVVANAARSISYQIRSAISTILVNSMTAMRPQATQNYANGNFTRFYNLIYLFSKILFCLACIMVLPFAFYITEILQLWLGIIPQYSEIFVLLILCHILVRSFHEPLDVIFKSSGRMKQYQLKSIFISVFTLPTSWILLKIGFPIYIVFLIMILSELLVLMSLLHLAQKDGLSIPIYIKKVILPSSRVLLINILFGIILTTQLNNIYFIFNILIFICFSILSIFTIGLEKGERQILLALIKKRRNG